MASGMIFMQWGSYQTTAGEPVFFRQEPLSFNSRQERLHSLGPGDRLWLVSRCPDDQQYYCIAVLHILLAKRNTPGTSEADFGEFAVVADRARSLDLGKRFHADGVLRVLEFDSSRPIKYGASIGQSLQALRILSADDERVLEAQLQRLLDEKETAFDAPFGLWTKCDRAFADYFLKNWQARREGLAFLLYDPPPVLRVGAPIFIHSDKHLRLIASFVSGQFVAGHKLTVEAEERVAERERIWTTYRAPTIEPPRRADFDAFWEKQNGIRALFIMERVTPVVQPVQFRVYGRALEWGFPTGVGYRYLSLSQSLLLLRAAGIANPSRGLR